MRMLCIDYGRRRLGMAVARADDAPVCPLPTIDRQRQPRLIEHLVSIIHDENPDVIVVGLPLDLDGNETAMSAEIRSFAAELGRSAGVPIRFIDESFSTVAATRLLRSRKRKIRRDKSAADRIAACLLLESFQREYRDERDLSAEKTIG